MTDEIDLEVISDRLPDEPAPEPEPQPEVPAEADGDQGAPDEESPPSADEEPADDDAGAEPPKKKKGGFQKRIDELTKARHELEREREYWREQALSTGKDRAQDVPQSTEQPASAPQAKPSQDQYDSYDTYLEALADWRYDQREQERERRAREKAEQEAAANQQRCRQQQLEDFKTRVEAFAAETPDAIEVIYDETVPITDAMLEVITASDIGPKLVYHLGKNRQEATRIANLSPIAAARELGRIEAKLSLPNPPKKATAAPEPFTALGSSESVDDSDNPPSDPAAFAVWWKNRTRRKTS